MNKTFITRAYRLFHQRDYLVKKIEQKIDHAAYIMLEPSSFVDERFTKETVDSNKKISHIIEDAIRDQYQHWLNEVELEMKELGLDTERPRAA